MLLKLLSVEYWSNRQGLALFWMLSKATPLKTQSVRPCPGNDSAEIAASLFLARKTVCNHVEHIYTKIGATNRVGATLSALRNALTDYAIGPEPFHCSGDAGTQAGFRRRTPN